MYEFSNCNFDFDFCRFDGLYAFERWIVLFETLLNAVRHILGTPNFYHQIGTGYQWDYGAMLEYAICGIILIVVVGSIFKFVRTLVK